MIIICGVLFQATEKVALLGKECRVIIKQTFYDKGHNINIYAQYAPLDCD